ncbi:hypothetical protein CDL15_Pgr017761 [Punica granatum]|uniref:Uncharacterized protein n=1 Tax=Punica granatum TaxID=22663 RepID=A0A218WHA2_PUNGR|nr:hypothetical protein CDL15_Pgr017761 [Punica granatum]
MAFVGDAKGPRLVIGTKVIYHEETALVTWAAASSSPVFIRRKGMGGRRGEREKSRTITGNGDNQKI